MDRDEIETLLRELSERLVQRDLVGEIAIYGGAAMVLAHRSRLATKDVDAVFAPPSRKSTMRQWRWLRSAMSKQTGSTMR